MGVVACSSAGEPSRKRRKGKIGVSKPVVSRWLIGVARLSCGSSRFTVIRCIPPRFESNILALLRTLAFPFHVFQPILFRRSHLPCSSLKTSSLCISRNFSHRSVDLFLLQFLSARSQLSNSISLPVITGEVVEFLAWSGEDVFQRGIQLTLFMNS